MYMNLFLRLEIIFQNKIVMKSFFRMLSDLSPQAILSNRFSQARRSWIVIDAEWKWLKTILYAIVGLFKRVCWLQFYFKDKGQSSNIIIIRETIRKRISIKIGTEITVWMTQSCTWSWPWPTFIVISNHHWVLQYYEISLTLNTTDQIIHHYCTTRDQFKY